ncbi:LysR family transcriptional regulator [Rugamonas sp. CCM 8940]|nr:LysR family transcriptional regulator [Rugamonas sp. CCM 8940]
MVVFAKVVEQRGFAAAARQLKMTASAVSRSVARLESHLGVKLLNRTTRSLSLTEPGADVYADCSRLVQAALDVEAQGGRHSDSPTGTVRMNAPTVFGELWLAPRLLAFFARWPALQIKLELNDRMIDLVDEGVDLAIRLALPESLPPGLVARPLFKTTYVLVASPAYLQARGAPQTPGQLAGHPCIYLGYGPFADRLEMRRDGALEAVRISGPLTINSSIGILATVDGGLGIGIVPDYTAAAGLRAGTLVRLFPDWTLSGCYTGRTVHIVYPPTRHVPKKVRVLIDHLVEVATPQPPHGAQ